MLRPTIDLRPFEWYIRISFYLFVVVWPLVGLAFAASLRRWSAVELTLVGVTGTAVCILSVLVAHGGIDRLRDAMATGRRARATPVPPIGIAWLASVAVALGVFSWWGLRNGVFPALLLAALLVTQAVAVVPVLSNRACLIGLAGLCVVFPLMVWFGLHLSWPEKLVTIVYGIFAAVLFAGSGWLTVWMLRVMWELDAARALAAQLAVAEERLRISRDLHDVFGRTLATISVKSTLAGELARRGRGPEAATELDDIRRIADDAGRETRAVVRGERGVDLRSELAGARSVLDSAGVRCELVVADQPVPARLSEPLAWVTREAVTNILRHSSASWARIIVESDPTRLTISNDHPLRGTSGTGTGLASMGQRLAGVGGELHTESRDDVFTLTAEFGDTR